MSLFENLTLTPPWKRSDFPGWRAQLKGPPTYLLVICGFQLVVLSIGLFLAIGGKECDYIVHGTNNIEINCDKCSHHTWIAWQSLALFFSGAFLLMIGVYAAIFRSSFACKAYGITMLLFAFVLGLASLLTGLDALVIESAKNSLAHTQDNEKCRSYTGAMVQTIKINAVLFAVNCLLDIAGALWAIKSKELFDYQALVEGYQKFDKDYHQL